MFCFFIPKTNGRDRLICIPTIEDRIVQKSILKYFSEYNKFAKFNGVSYGFIKNKSTQDAMRDAIKTRCKKPFAYETGISSFFDTLDRSILQSLIKNKIREKSLKNENYVYRTYYIFEKASCLLLSRVMLLVC